MTIIQGSGTESTKKHGKGNRVIIIEKSHYLSSSRLIPNLSASRLIFGFLEFMSAKTALYSATAKSSEKLLSFPRFNIRAEQTVKILMIHACR